MPGILFEFEEAERNSDTVPAPDYFGDLNLDKVVDAVTRGKQEYDLKPFFHAPLHSLSAIRYRQQVMRDLETAPVRAAVDAFAQAMRLMREQLELANKMYYQRQKQRWFLDAVYVYCQAAVQLTNDLAQAEICSTGLCAVRDAMTAYVRSDAFETMWQATQQIQATLSALRYAVRIKGNAVQVLNYDGEPDYGTLVEQTFARFKQGAVKDYTVKYADWNEMNHVEAQVLDFVAQLNPEIFAALAEYCARYAGFLDETVSRFDRQVQFYLSYLDYIGELKRTGLPFCYPRVSETDKAVCAQDAFDLALAQQLVSKKTEVVRNDFALQGQERILVVTGPNQGGKTTFARMFGQLHYLASLGCPVPGRRAELYLSDRLFTHFEREENIENLRGKLEDDLVRIHEILAQATPRSIILLNEIFTSTTLHDARFLSEQMLGRVMELDCLCVCVTFIDELARLSDTVVSMASTVEREDPTHRTFKIIRKPADGLAYALSLAAKYGLDYPTLKKRVNA